MRKLVLVLYFIIFSQYYAQESGEYETLIEHSEKLAYNFEFDSCNILLNIAVPLAPHRPEVYLLKSKIHLWYFLGSKEELDYNLFFAYSDTTIFKLDSLLEKNDEDKELIYQLGNVYKYRAMAYGNNGNTLDAFWSTKKAVSYFEDVIDIDPEYYSAYGGIGVFEYALSYVPALFNWALSLSGLSADQNNGFEYINLASQKGEKDKIEYQFHLSKLFDEYLAEYERSLNLLEPLLNKFPNNSLFHYQAAIELIKLKELDDAISELEIVLNINHPKFIQTNSFSNFLLGDIYFRKGEYQKALDFYLLFLTSSKTIDYTGIASLRVAYCNYFLENQNEFRRYLLLAANGNLDLEDDKYAKEMSQFILGNGFSIDRKILIEIENSFLSGNDNQTIKLIEENLDTLKNEDILAQIVLYKSTILIDKRNFELAKKSLLKIDSLNIETAYWVEPLTLINNAKISLKENNIDMALNYLEDAEDSNDHQKKNYINSLINGLKRKLKNHK